MIEQRPSSFSQDREPVSRHEHPVYLLAREDLGPARPEPISIVDVWNIIWRGRWIVVATTAIVAVLSVIYALTATEWYRVEMVLAPEAQNSNRALAGALGGLGALGELAGLGMNNKGSVEAIAVLESDDFTRDFVRDQNLLPILFAKKWDAAAGKWNSDDPKSWPDLEDGVELIDKGLRRIQEDRKTGLVKLTLDWTDRDLAAKWANLMVERLNERMRQRALTEADANVTYLRGVLQSEGTVALQQSIGRLLESELQKLMLARGKREFSFQIIDRAEPPKWRQRPKRTQIVLVATVFGGMLGVLIVLFRTSLLNDLQRSRRRSELVS
jgi:uncharacterized protein involved in exopolysaccharide biosynthesis